MSRQSLLDFINSSERNVYLREKLKSCKSFQGLIDIAKEYGFNVTSLDIDDCIYSDEITEFFKINKINPLNKF